MGLFNKKKKEESSYSSNSAGLPELPKLPELPQLPASKSGSFGMKPNALPRYPSNSLGDKFSQNTIKDAVSGEKEDEDDVIDDFENEIKKMPRLPSMPSKKGRPDTDEPEQKGYRRAGVIEEDEEMPEEMEPVSASPVSSPGRFSSPKDEPVFVRIDKFEESMELFEKMKKQVLGVDKMLNEIKTIKEREENELQEWQSRLEEMKSQIERIDREMFSKVE